MEDFEPRGADELFDALADEYDAVRRELGWDPFPHVEAALGADRLDGMWVLDVGCGTGEVAGWLVARGAQVWGVDVSAQMCFEAASRVPQATFSHGDLGADGLARFDAARFDAVLALGCIEYVADIEAACGELVRVTRPGGTVLCAIELCGPHMPDGPARSVRFLDEWQRHRRTLAEVEALCARLFAGGSVRTDQVPGYVLEDSGEWVQYARVIGRVAAP